MEQQSREETEIDLLKKSFNEVIARYSQISTRLINSCDRLHDETWGLKSGEQSEKTKPISGHINDLTVIYMSLSSIASVMEQQITKIESYI